MVFYDYVFVNPNVVSDIKGILGRYYDDGKEWLLKHWEFMKTKNQNQKNRLIFGS